MGSVFTLYRYGDNGVASDLLARRQRFVCGGHRTIATGSALDDHGRADLHRFIHGPLDRADQSGAGTKLRAMGNGLEAYVPPARDAESDLFTSQLVGQLG